LNKTAAKASTLTKRDLAAAKGVPQKAIKKVIKVFKASKQLLTFTLWIGLKRGIPFDELQTGVAKKRLSKPFRARFKNGKVAEGARRILPSFRAGKGRSPDDKNLPVDYKVRLNPEAKRILEEKADYVGRNVFGQEYTRQLKLKLQKLNVT